MKRYDIDLGHHVTGSGQEWRVEEEVNGDWVKYEDIKHLLDAPKNTIHNTAYAKGLELLKECYVELERNGISSDLCDKIEGYFA